ncbi:hypothetical protein EYZ11_002994 [Aspergillus tanneri]|uniref:Uncharacterized protein n=1 Tax=Aspergillus tanneri TaxID=1220188 RepID=A0A4V3UQ33_9EURO|nr:hypothetical protein EYZ11_002994 [Aspergillus tanneri]
MYIHRVGLRDNFLPKLVSKVALTRRRVLDSELAELESPTAAVFSNGWVLGAFRGRGVL